MKRIAIVVVFVVFIFTLDGCGCEHEFDDWKETKKATSFEEGTQKRTCSKCGKVEEETIAKKGDHGVKLSSSEMESKAKDYV